MVIVGWSPGLVLSWLGDKQVVAMAPRKAGSKAKTASSSSSATKRGSSALDVQQNKPKRGRPRKAAAAAVGAPRGVPASAASINMEAEIDEDEEVVRRRDLLYRALDSAVVGSGVFAKEEIFRLSQVCRTLTRIIRQRVLAIGGAPKVKEEMGMYTYNRPIGTKGNGSNNSSHHRHEH